MTDLAALISRLEAASGPDREIDALIEAVCYDGPASIVCDSDNAERGHYWVSIDGGRTLFSSTPVTASLDAITALIQRALPGWDIHMSLFSAASDDDAYVSCRIEPNYETDSPFDEAWVNAPTPALALCLALVRAKAAMMEKSE